MTSGGLDLTAESLDAAADQLRSARRVLLLAHAQPDADALGSAGALALALQTLGIEPVITFERPDTVPQSLASLPGLHLVRPAGDVVALLDDPQHRPDLAVALDSGSPDRLGRFAGLVGGTTGIPLLVIDHHASNDHYGDLNLVDPHADATVLLVEQLLPRLGAPLTTDIAQLLYAGLATDTGNFRHCRPEAHRSAATLLEAGVDAEALMESILDSHPFGWLGMLGRVLARAQLVPDAARGRGLVHTWVGAEDLAGLRPEEADAVIDILRSASEAAVACVVKHSAAGGWTVSLRSREGVNVGDVAVRMGGGGHPRAAGFSWSGPPEHAVAALLLELDPESR